MHRLLSAFALGLCTVLSSSTPATAASLKFTKEREVQLSEAPVSLTASDGTGLKLDTLQVRGVMEGMLAFTEVKLTFENPKSRTIEGRFSITLPDGARLSRFAMKIGNDWQEGEVVEKQAARRAYEDFLHRKQDPALLEDTGTRTFTARVFPIPANGKKELILSYSHVLTQKETPYVFPLQGLPQVGTLDVKVVGGAAPFQLQKTKTTPARDVTVAQRSGAREAITAGRTALVRVTPVQNTPPSSLKSLYVLVDTSASRGGGFAAQVATVKDLLDAVAQGAGKIPLRVDAFDQDIAPLFDGKADTKAAAHVAKRLKQRRSLGATDAHLALAKAKARADGYQRVLVVTDGAFTLGDTDTGVLVDDVKRLKSVGVRRLDVLTVGAAANLDRLRSLVTAGLNEDGAVVDGNAAYKNIAHALTHQTKSNLRVSVKGARWVWPEVLDAMQEGESAVIAVAFEGKAPKRIQGRVGGQPFVVDKAAPAQGPLLQRAFAGAQLESMMQKRSLLASSAREARAKLKDDIVKLSIAQRVLCPLTALLVLETERDYQRFNITRNSLTDILVVEAGEVVLKKRKWSDIKKAPPPTPKPKPAIKGKKMKKKRRKRRVNRSRAPAAPADAFKEDAKMGAPQPDEDDADVGDAEMAESEPAEQAAPMPASAPPPAPRLRRFGESRAESSADGLALRGTGSGGGGDGRGGLSVGGSGRGRGVAREEAERRPVQEVKLPDADPWDGRFKQIQTLLGADGKGVLSSMAGTRASKRNAKKALQLAWQWREENAGDVLALVALGNAAQALNDVELALRAYGSLVDLFPGRADLLRFSGTLLSSAPAKRGLPLAVLAFERARAERKDHPNSHRFLGWALAKQGKLDEAFAVFKEGRAQSYPSGRFAAAHRILAEDLGLITAMRIRKQPKKKQALLKELQAANGNVEDKASLRFVMSWETDANDVDFHIFDKKGGHAYYSSKHLPSGGDLYADVTTGYGPECFTTRLPKQKRSGPYVLMAHYYSRGPMGYGMGGLDVIEHDGNGNITHQVRPYVVMKDGAYLHLGKAK